MRYKEVWEGKSAEIVEKKSRFIAHVASVYTVEEAQEFIDRIKKEYWDARHNCSAFFIGTDQPVSRCSDDGEPAGTAGKPILEVILGSGIHNIAVVVTRYFGGTLLGTGGLVRAYTQATRLGIEASAVIEKVKGRRVALHMDYTDLGKIQYVLAGNRIAIEDTTYADDVTIWILVEEESYDLMCKKVTESSSARVRIEPICDLFFGIVDGEIVTFE